MSLKQSSSGVKIAASIAGTIANFIVPGSGSIVAQGVEIVAPLAAAAFSSAKNSGKTDAQAAAAAAAVADPQLVAAAKAAAELDGAYQHLVSKMSSEDKKLNTLFKGGKMQRINHADVLKNAVASGQIDPSALRVYSQASPDPFNDLMAAGVGAAGAFAGAPPAASQESAKVPGAQTTTTSTSPSFPVLGAILLGGAVYFAMTSKPQYRRRNYGGRNYGGRNYGGRNYRRRKK